MWLHGADGARVRDALHTVMMDSGGAAYARLVWQLGFTIVEVLAIAPAIPLPCSTCCACWDSSQGPSRLNAHCWSLLVTNTVNSSGFVPSCSRAGAVRSSRQLLGDAQVRMSPDNMTAFVLWDAHDDSLFSAEREIGYRSGSACGIVGT